MLEKIFCGMTQREAYAEAFLYIPGRTILLCGTLSKIQLYANRHYTTCHGYVKTFGRDKIQRKGYFSIFGKEDLSYKLMTKSEVRKRKKIKQNDKLVLLYDYKGKLFQTETNINEIPSGKNFILIKQHFDFSMINSKPKKKIQVIYEIIETYRKLPKQYLRAFKRRTLCQKSIYMTM